MKRVALVVALALAAIAGTAELAYWLAAHLAATGAEGGSCAVLVLGYPNDSDGSPGPIQRLRVEAGVAAYRAHGCSRLVVSGAAVHNRYVEAESMARLASELGVPASDVVVEDRARSTWENVGCSVASLRGLERIFVASDSLHALRGRRYLCRQQPELCERAWAVGDDPPVSLLWWKVPAALYELRAWARDRLIHEREPASNAVPCPEAGA